MLKRLSPDSRVHCMVGNDCLRTSKAVIERAIPRELPISSTTRADIKIFRMGCDENVAKQLVDKTQQPWTLILHPFSDLTHVSPVVFLSLLKQCYFYGTSKATAKFRALQQVHLALRNNPQPGPATYVVHCLYVLPLLESYCEGFCHLIVSALRRTLKVKSVPTDCLEARDLAAQLYLDIVLGFVNHDERILLKILEVFDVKLENIEKAMCNSGTEKYSIGMGKAFIEKYILQSIEAQSYLTAVSLLEQFSIREAGESFLYKMIESKNFRAAEKWATFMGKSMLCKLVDEYVNMNMLKAAYGVIKRNNLQAEFQDVYQKCKESSLKRLAEKGCWDVAEERTKHDKQLLEYLVYLAMEAGYSEKVVELCDRYTLDGFVRSKELDVGPPQSQYLQLHEFSIDDVIWVDEVESLQDATSYIEGCKVVGIDCEWKPNYVKGSKPNKVSIVQLATEKIAFIFDLIKLYGDNPGMLDSCLSRILHSPRILKLGYNFHCDIHQLARSYNELECFKHYDMLLDIQNVFKESRGGLSGLAEKVLGAGLNKTRRNSNWEQRPLSKKQLEYAALDAVVLIHIFWHLHSHPQASMLQDCDTKIEWRSQIISHMDHSKRSMKKR